MVVKIENNRRSSGIRSKEVIYQMSTAELPFDIFECQPHGIELCDPANNFYCELEFKYTSSFNGVHCWVYASMILDVILYIRYEFYELASSRSVFQFDAYSNDKYVGVVYFHVHQNGMDNFAVEATISYIKSVQPIKGLNLCNGVYMQFPCGTLLASEIQQLKTYNKVVAWPLNAREYYNVAMDYYYSPKNFLDDAETSYL